MLDQPSLEVDADQPTDQLRRSHPSLAHDVRARQQVHTPVYRLTLRSTAFRSVEFEKNLPFHWRCRPAWEALISISGSPEEAVKTSPSTDKHDLRLTAQRHVLALNIADAVLFLQRPYFTKALYESPLNPCQSKYASSFLAVFERCIVGPCRQLLQLTDHGLTSSNPQVTIRINQSISTLYPAFSQRQWFFSYQTFTVRPASRDRCCVSSADLVQPT